MMFCILLITWLRDIIYGNERQDVQWKEHLLTFNEEDEGGRARVTISDE